LKVILCGESLFFNEDLWLSRPSPRESLVQIQAASRRLLAAFMNRRHYKQWRRFFVRQETAGERWRFDRTRPNGWPFRSADGALQGVFLASRQTNFHRQWQEKQRVREKNWRKTIFFASGVSPVICLAARCRSYFGDSI
jgi:hypothetical protein